MTRSETDVPPLLQALSEYATARRRLLEVLGLPTSNRDPIPEVAEQLVAGLLGGTVAESRVQPGWDVQTPEGKVQVRTLSNTSADRWNNEHLVRITHGVDRYALVVLEDFTISAVLVFPADLTAVGALLGKRHGAQGTSLQFTRRDFRHLVKDRSAARTAGVMVWTPEDLPPADNSGVRE